MKMTATICAGLAILSVGCRNSASDGSGEMDGAEVSSAPVELNIRDWIATAGFIVDLNGDSAGKRMQWLSLQSANLAVNQAAPMPAPGAVGCKIAISYQGKVQDISVDEGAAYPHPNGRVMYCDRQKLYYAPTDTASPKLMMEMGITFSEISGIRFYRVPTATVNAWATVFNGTSIITVYDGLGAEIRARGLDDKSILGITLAHELGHILDMKKAGFTNLNAARQRILETCENRVKGLDPKSVTYSVRKESCMRDLASNTRSYEYSADNNAVTILARKKYSQSIDPYAFTEFARQLGEGKYNPFNSHPDGVERALQMTRSLERAGVPRKTPAKPNSGPMVPKSDSATPVPTTSPTGPIF